MKLFGVVLFSLEISKLVLDFPDKVDTKMPKETHVFVGNAFNREDAVSKAYKEIDEKWKNWAGDKMVRTISNSYKVALVEEREQEKKIENKLVLVEKKEDEAGQNIDKFIFSLSMIADRWAINKEEKKLIEVIKGRISKEFMVVKEKTVDKSTCQEAK